MYLHSKQNQRLNAQVLLQKQSKARIKIAKDIKNPMPARDNQKKGRILKL